MAFFFNSHRFRREKEYYNANFRPHELPDFDWDSISRPNTKDGQSCNVPDTAVEIDQDVRQTNKKSVFSIISNEMAPDLHETTRDRGDGVFRNNNNNNEVVIRSPYASIFRPVQLFFKSVLHAYTSFAGIWSDDEDDDDDNDSDENVEQFNESLLRSSSNENQSNELHKSNVVTRKITKENLEQTLHDLINLDDHNLLEDASVNMVEMDEDVLVYRERRGSEANRLRRVHSSESESSSTDGDGLVAGPPMIDFNEPLPNIQENEEIQPNPIYNGDIGLRIDFDTTLANAGSNTSRGNLQNVVSQLGLEIPIQNKLSCHSHHLHSLQQSSCCRHAAHNISIESLDLDITGSSTRTAYCCGNLGNKFDKRLGCRKSCSSIN